MKAIAIRTLAATDTQPYRFKIWAAEHKPLTISKDSYVFFPDDINSKCDQDKALYLADHYFRNVLKWDQDNKYKLVDGTHPNGDRVYVQVLK